MGLVLHWQVWLGGGPNQTRLAETFMERVKLQDLEKVLEPLFFMWRSQREAGEAFGDFAYRQVFASTYLTLIPTHTLYCNFLLYPDHQISAYSPFIAHVHLSGAYKYHRQHTFATCKSLAFGIVVVPFFR